MTAIRAMLMAAGAAVAAWGGWLLIDSGLDNIVSAAWWAVGGIVAHDALLAPATLGVVVLAATVLPGWARGPATVGLVVIGTVTIVAIPVLSGQGRRPDNPTLLDRDYWGGWLVFVAVVLLAVAWASWRRLRMSARRVEEV